MPGKYAGAQILSRTRLSLHAVAELVLAGPQYRRGGSIELRASPGGFATTELPDLAVAGILLLAGGRRLAVLSGVTCAELAELAGVEAARPDVGYPGGSGLGPDAPLQADEVSAQIIAAAFDHGDTALRRFAPSAAPVLWPEHFDIGITLDEVNYGVSPGDEYLAEPYAYVGPWQRRQGLFWNAPFGAARPLAQFPDAEAIRQFFVDGQRLAAQTRRPREGSARGR